MVIESEGSHQEKNGLFSGQADLRVDTAPLRSISRDFFVGLHLSLDYD